MNLSRTPQGLDRLAKWVKQRRDELGIESQERLAATSGLSLSTVQRIESARYWPGRSTLQQLAAALRVEYRNMMQYLEGGTALPVDIADPELGQDVKDRFAKIYDEFMQRTPGLFLESFIMLSGKVEGGEATVLAAAVTCFLRLDDDSQVPFISRAILRKAMPAHWVDRVEAKESLLKLKLAPAGTENDA